MAPHPVPKAWFISRPVQAYSGLLSSFLRLVPRDWKMLSAAVIGADVLFGVAFVTITIVAVTVVRVFLTYRAIG